MHCSLPVPRRRRSKAPLGPARIALRAGGDWPARRNQRFGATEKLVAAHTSLRSASFRNSLRGAAGLAAAVLIGQLASLQHSFWVVLAMLSVLRSNALGTGSTVLQALAGTAAGIVIGGALVAAIGSDEPVLWALLPPAILLAAYAPRAISFAAGQAGFTIVLFILFNIIQLTGWTVGLVRVEDVAIGFAVSLAVGLLFWPRGVGDLLRESLGAAYARSADYVASATRRLVAVSGPGRTEPSVPPARQIARAAANRLDDAFRDYLAESSTHQENLEGVATLVAGTTRVRLAAYSLSTLTPAPAGPPIDECAEALAAQVDALRSWYLSLADALAEWTEIPPPHPRGDDDDRQVVRCVPQALAAGDGSMVAPALTLLWASQHVDNLWELGAQLTQPAAEFSSRGARARHPPLRGVLRPHPS
ncbi:MAG: FUSC family protein [Solirubrobacteraceae bacterium]